MTMTDGWGGDPGHSGAKPMMHLQGGMAGAHTQMSMESEAATLSIGTDNAPVDTVWNASTIAGGNRGGDTPNRDTSSNGHRGAPSPA
jgi:hypothetical protein